MPWKVFILVARHRKRRCLGDRGGDGGDGGRRETCSGRLRNLVLFSTARASLIHSQLRDKSRRSVSRVNAIATPSEPSLVSITAFSRRNFHAQPACGTLRASSAGSCAAEGQSGPKLSRSSARPGFGNTWVSRIGHSYMSKLNTLASKHVPCLRRVPTRPKPNGAAGLSPSARPDYIVPGTSLPLPKIKAKKHVQYLSLHLTRHEPPLRPHLTADDSTQRVTTPSDPHFQRLVKVRHPSPARFRPVLHMRRL